MAPSQSKLVDGFGRIAIKLRISITDIRKGRAVSFVRVPKYQRA
jgi:hypothetical protein